MAVIPASFSTVVCFVLAVSAVRSVIRGWWLVVIVDVVALVPGVWFSLNRWRLYRSR